MKYILLLILLASSCGRFSIRDTVYDPTGKRPRKDRSTNPAFYDYILDFELEYGEEIRDIPINFAEMEGTKAGVCYIWKKSGYAEIEINERMWKNKLTHEKKLALIFHELGHCELNRNHTDGSLKDSCPNSIMNSFLPTQDCLETHMDHYLSEMFE